MPNVVISDFGGVLTSPLIGSFMAFQDSMGISARQLGTAMNAVAEKTGRNPLHELEKGHATEADFLDQLAGTLEVELGHRPEMHKFSETFFSALEPNQPMIELMWEAKRAGRRMALLTNNVREWEPVWRSMAPVDEIFELIVDSAFVGCRKPDPEIYELTVSGLGVKASDCLFIDDMEINCDGARAVGLNPVHFRDNDQAIAEIRAAIGL